MMRRSWMIVAAAMLLLAVCTVPVYASDIDTDGEAEVVMDLDRAGGVITGKPAAAAPAAAAAAPKQPVAAAKPAPVAARRANLLARAKAGINRAVQRAGNAVQKGAQRVAAGVKKGVQKLQAGVKKLLAKKAQQKQAPGAKKPLTAKKATKRAKKAQKRAAKSAKKLAAAKKAVQKASGKKAKKAAKKAVRKAKKAARKAKKASKKAARKAKKVAKKATKKAKKARKGKKQGKILKAKKAGAKPLRLTGHRLRAALRRVGRAAFLKGKKLGWSLKKIRKFVRAQIRGFRSRHQPKPAAHLKDLKLKQLVGKVANKQSRAAISKLQAALKKKAAGSVELPIKHHKITIHPRTPTPKKLKIHRPSPTDKNYVKHLEQSKKAWKKKIKALENAIVQLGPKGKHDWEIEYGTLDPPDEGKAAMLHEILTDLKPFLKDAVSIKQQDLAEGRENLETMEALRWVVHDKLVKARATPLLPEDYRFIE